MAGVVVCVSVMCGRQAGEPASSRKSKSDQNQLAKLTSSQPAVCFGAEQDEVDCERENREADMQRYEGPANIEMMPNLVHDCFLIPDALVANSRLKKRTQTGDLGSLD